MNDIKTLERAKIYMSNNNINGMFDRHIEGLDNFITKYKSQVHVEEPLYGWPKTVDPTLYIDECEEYGERTDVMINTWNSDDAQKVYHLIENLKVAMEDKDNGHA